VLTPRPQVNRKSGVAAPLVFDPEEIAAGELFVGPISPCQGGSRR
jgi:hypothetical protein